MEGAERGLGPAYVDSRSRGVAHGDAGKRGAARWRCAAGSYREAAPDVGLFPPRLLVDRTRTHRTWRKRSLLVLSRVCAILDWELASLGRRIAEAEQELLNQMQEAV